jgi:hypothetical protein
MNHCAAQAHNISYENIYEGRPENKDNHHTVFTFWMTYVYIWGVNQASNLPGSKLRRNNCRKKVKLSL